MDIVTVPGVSPEGTSAVTSALRAVRELAERGHRDIVAQKERITRLVELIDKQVKDETIRKITDEIRRTLEQPAPPGAL